MSSKAKRPTVGDRLVRVKDLLAMNRAWLVRIEALEKEVRILRGDNAKVD